MTPDHPVVEPLAEGSSEAGLQAYPEDGSLETRPDMPETDISTSEPPVASNGAGDVRFIPPPAPRADGIAAPNEFTFGWHDLEMDSSTGPSDVPSDVPSLADEQPVAPSAKRRDPGRHPAPKVQNGQGRQLGEPLRGQVGRLARQAAESLEPVAAVGLIAATGPLVLQEDERLAPVADRLLPPLLSAASWAAWQLHRNPARRGRLALLPEAMRRVAAVQYTHDLQGQPLSARRILRLLLREVEAQAAKPGPSRRAAAAPRLDALARLDQVLAEWWQDEPSGQ